MIVAFLITCFIAQPCLAWSEGGHHLIAVLAYELLTESQQEQIQTILASHPRFAEDFVVPEKISGAKEKCLWLIGRAGHWPDIARKTKWDCPNWHYEVAATLVIGEVKNVPSISSTVQVSANLNSKSLHIFQAIEMCRRVAKDRSSSDSDRALAICWLAHLVGDAHQPCHAGSLFVEGVFPDGDRGANLIPTKQSQNLHKLWDGLLGSNFNAGDVRRRANSITSEVKIWNEASETAKNPNGLNPLTWLTESSEYAKSHVYTPEVLTAVEAAARRGQKVETVHLSEEYLKAAGEVARVRAAFAAQRLSEILAESLR
jgi:hypothetical protein